MAKAPKKPVRGKKPVKAPKTLAPEIKRPPGRPSSYTEALGDDICQQLASGTSLREICRQPGMPDKRTVLRWLGDPAREAFRTHYAAARDEQADAMFEELLDIADNGENDWMVRNGKDGNQGWAENGECLRRSQLRIDTRKWILARMAPKKYGEKLGLDTNPVMDPIAALMQAVDGTTPILPSDLVES